MTYIPTPEDVKEKEEQLAMLEKMLQGGIEELAQIKKDVDAKEKKRPGAYASEMKRLNELQEKHKKYLGIHNNLKKYLDDFKLTGKITMVQYKGKP